MVFLLTMEKWRFANTDKNKQFLGQFYLKLMEKEKPTFKFFSKILFIELIHITTITLSFDTNNTVFRDRCINQVSTSMWDFY